jgi:hypothetical protein
MRAEHVNARSISTVERMAVFVAAGLFTGHLEDPGFSRVVGVLAVLVCVSAIGLVELGLALAVYVTLRIRRLKARRATAKACFPND